MGNRFLQLTPTMRKLAGHRHRVAAAAAVLGVACVFEVAAAINEWTDGVGTSSWADAPNWSAQAVPRTGEALLFGDIGTSAPLALNGSYAAGSLNFAAAGPVTVNANTASGDWRSLKLTGGTNAFGGTDVLVISSAVASAVTLGQEAGHGALSMILPITSSIAIPNAASTLVLGANTTLTKSPGFALNLTKVGAGTLVVKGDLDASNLVQAGGTMVLDSATQHSGTTTVTGGTLIVADSYALQYSAVSPASGLQFVAGLGKATFGGLKGSGSLALQDTAGASISLEIADATSTYSGVLSGPGGLTRSGYNFAVPLPSMGVWASFSRGGALVLTGANTYSGPTIVSGTTSQPFDFFNGIPGGISLALDFTAVGAPASNIISASSLLVFGGANLSSGGALAIRSSATKSQSFAGTTVAEGASYLNVAQQAGALTVALGPLTRTGGTLDVTSNGTVTATGALTNGILGGWATTSTSFTKNWATLSSGKLVSFTGYTAVGAAAIPSNPAANYRVAQSSATTFTFGANGTTTDLNTLWTGSTNLVLLSAASDSGVLRFGALGGLLATAGASTIGAGVGNGRVTAGGADNTAAELVVTGSGPVTIRSRLVDNGSGAFMLSKSDTSTLTLLDPANSYTGGTVVDQGMLSAIAVGALGRNAAGTAGGDVIVKSGGVVRLGAGTWDNNFAISGNGASNYRYGALWLNGTTLSGDVRLVTNASISSNGNVPSTVSGVVSGPGTLQNASANLVQLPTIFTNAANSFAGGIGIRDGMLVFTTPGALSSDTRRNILMSGGALGLTFPGVQAVLDRRFATNNVGTIAVAPVNAGESIDLSEHGANLGFISLGGYGDVTFTGTYTPAAGVYRLGGGFGIFTYAPDLAGQHRVVIGQPSTSTTTVLAGRNTYSGGTTFQGGTASFASLGDFGSGRLTFSGGTLLFAPGNTADISSRATYFSSTAVLDVGANNVALANSVGGNGAGGLTKLGTGTLTLNAPAAYSGLTSITAGTLVANVAGAIPRGGDVRLDGPSATSPEVPMLALGVDLSVGNLSSYGVASGSPISQILLNGHRLTFASASFPGSLTFAIRGNGDLVKIGESTATLSNGNSSNGSTDFIGSVAINGGVLDLVYLMAYNTPPTTNILPSANPLSLGGGALSVTNRTSSPVTQTFDKVTINPGANRLSTVLDTSTATLATSLLQRTVAGGTVDFSVSAGSSITTKTANTAGTILGGWATFGGDQFAVSAGNGSTAGVVSGLSKGTGSFTAGGNVDATGTASVASLPINSLRFNAAGLASVDATTGLRVNSGGILLGSAQAGNPVSINQGTITSGNGRDLIVTSAGVTVLTISSKITGAIGLTKSGAGTLAVTNGSNDFTGPVTVNGGVLQIAGSGVLGNNAIAINGHGGTTAQLQVGAGVVLNNPISISGTNVDPAQGTIMALGAVTLNGPITIASEARATEGGTFSGPLTVNGPINAPAGAVVSSRGGAVVLAGGGNYEAYSIMADTTTLGAQDGLSRTAVLEIGSLATAALDLHGHHQTLAGLSTDSIFTGTIFNNTTTAATLTLDVPAGAAYSTKNTLSGLVSLVKTGAGSQTFTRPQSYTGTTAINGGTLEMDSTNTSAFTVNAGGVLCGTGTVGALTVENGGTLAPGTTAPALIFTSADRQELSDGLGVLRSGDLLLAAGAHLTLQLGTETLSDAISVAGTISLAGDLSFSLAPAFEEVLGSKFFIALNDGTDAVTGTFVSGATVSDSAGHLFEIDYADNGDEGNVGNDISATLVALPEPGSAALLGLAGLLLGGRRAPRRNSRGRS